MIKQVNEDLGKDNVVVAYHSLMKEDKQQFLEDLVMNGHQMPVLIYMNKKQEAEKLCSDLVDKGYNVDTLSNKYGH